MGLSEMWWATQYNHKSYALCDGVYPANYEGCEFYHSLIKHDKQAKYQQKTNRHPSRKSDTIPEQPPHQQYQQHMSYARVIKASRNQTVKEENNMLSKFLED